MTSFNSYMAQQVAALREEIAELKGQRVTYLQVPVTSVNTGNSTFGAAIPDSATGGTVNLTGIASPAQFLPHVGDTVTLALSGAQLIYQPNRLADQSVTGGQIADGAVGSVQIAPDSISTDQIAFNLWDYSGSTIYLSPTEPAVPNGDDFHIGDLWLQDTGATGPGGQQYITYRWDGNVWVQLQDQGISQALADAFTAQNTAESAQTTADSKVKYFVQSTTPTYSGAANTAVWINTGNDNLRLTWSGSAWVARTISTGALTPNSIIASDVIATGTVSAALLEAIMVLSNTIIAGTPSHARIELDANGLRAYNSSNTPVGKFDNASGTWLIVGQYKSFGTGGRTVIVDGQIDSASGGSGRAVGAAGIVWQASDANRTRYAQLYDGGTFQAIDSPAYSTTLSDGIPRYGSSTQTDCQGLYVYAMNDRVRPSLTIRNDGSMALGRVGIAGSSFFLATPTYWQACGGSSTPNLVGTDGGNVQLYLANTHTFEILSSGGGGLNVTGNFIVSGTKSFRIDHPDDPTRYLQHNCVEGPTAQVQYTGTVTLNASGRATVTLPGYFEGLTLTTGRTVQVTLIGQPGQVGADRPVNGQFTVYGPPNREVDWLVHATRRNAEFEVEPLKPAQQDSDPTWVPANPAQPDPPGGKGHWQQPPRVDPFHPDHHPRSVMHDPAAARPHVAHAHRFAAARAKAADRATRGVKPDQTPTPQPGEHTDD